jgi:hypothetical protein
MRLTGRDVFERVGRRPAAVADGDHRLAAVAASSRLDLSWGTVRRDDAHVLVGAELISTPTAPQPRSSRIWANTPLAESPIRIGGESRSRTCGRRARGRRRDASLPPGRMKRRSRLAGGAGKTGGGGVSTLGERWQSNSGWPQARYLPLLAHCGIWRDLGGADLFRSWSVGVEIRAVTCGFRS